MVIEMEISKWVPANCLIRNRKRPQLHLWLGQVYFERLFPFWKIFIETENGVSIWAHKHREIIGLDRIKHIYMKSAEKLF